MANRLYEKYADLLADSPGPGTGANTVHHSVSVQTPVEVVVSKRRGNILPVLVLCTLGPLLAIGIIGAVVLELDSRAARHRPQSNGISAVEEEAWAKTWPTLTFPPRPATIAEGTAVEYDEFRDYTSFTATIRRDDYWLTFLTTERGKVTACPAPPSSVTVSCTKENYELIFLVDGERILPAHGIIGFSLRTQDLLRMCDAKSVRYRLNGGDYTLTPFELRAIRDFASFLRP